MHQVDMPMDYHAWVSMLECNADTTKMTNTDKLNTVSLTKSCAKIDLLFMNIFNAQLHVHLKK